MRKLEITCDNCGKDLTYTGNCEDYYLSLDNVSKRREPGTQVVTMMGISPPIQRSMDFCGVECLLEKLSPKQ